MNALPQETVYVVQAIGGLIGLVPLTVAAVASVRNGRSLKRAAWISAENAAQIAIVHDLVDGNNARLESKAIVDTAEINRLAIELATLRERLMATVNPIDPPKAARMPPPEPEPEPEPEKPAHA